MKRVKKSPLIVVTEDIKPDEPCFVLSELIRKTPDGKSWHRYQFLAIVRNDNLVQRQIDLGPRELFRTKTGDNEFRIPGGVMNHDTGRVEILHTVAELQDIAEGMRFDPIKVEEPPTETKVFQEKFYNLLEARQNYRKRRRVYGYQK